MLMTSGCESAQRRRDRLARAYVESHPDLTLEVKNGILAGRVLPGMFPDEAHAAAGSFVYQVENMPEGAFPPDIIFSQRERPLAGVVIKLRFRNGTQFDTTEPVPFVVVFENGRAVRICSPEDEWVEEALSGVDRERKRKFQEIAITWISHAYIPRDAAAEETVKPTDISTLLGLIRQEGRSSAQQTNECEGAAAALGKLGRRTVPALVEALSDDRERVRQYACLALEYMGPEAEMAIPALHRMLRGPGESDRSLAADALGKIGSAARAAVPDLLPLLRSNAVFAQCSGLKALGCIGDKSQEVLRSISVALKDSNAEVRLQARIALTRIERSKDE